MPVLSIDMTVCAVIDVENLCELLVQYMPLNNLATFLNQRFNNAAKYPTFSLYQKGGSNFLHCGRHRYFTSTIAKTHYVLAIVNTLLCGSSFNVELI